MVLGQLGLDIGPAVAGLGSRRHRRRVRRPEPRPRLPQRRLILIENQFAKGDVIRVAGVAGTVEDFTLRRTTLRDLDGVVHTVPERRDQRRLEPDPRLVADQPGRHGRLRDRHRQGDRGRRRGRPRDGRRPGLEAARPRGTAGRARRGPRRVRRHAQDPRHRPGADQWAAAGDLRKRLLAAFKENGIEIPRPQRVVLTRNATAERQPRQDDDDLPRHGAWRRRSASRTCRAGGGGAVTEQLGVRELNGGPGNAADARCGSARPSAVTTISRAGHALVRCCQPTSSTRTP